jgi:hypothetical protein
LLTRNAKGSREKQFKTKKKRKTGRYRRIRRKIKAKVKKADERGLKKK